MSMLHRITLLILVACFLSACNGLYETPETKYVIKKGEHKSSISGSLTGKGFRSLKSETLKFNARFDETAIYQLSDNDQGDINKLFGVSDCNSHHQTNSARFGWNYDPDINRINIYAYVYEQSKRKHQLLGSVGLHETAEYKLSITSTSFIFWFNDESVSFDRGSTCEKGLYYLLFPFFGGNQPAPHDIHIFIQEHL